MKIVCSSFLSTSVGAGILAGLAFAAIPAQANQAQPAVPTNSCQSVAGTLGSTSRFTEIVDGTKLKDGGDIERLRAKAKDGKTIAIKGGNFSGFKFGNDNYSNLCFLGSNLSNTKWSRSRASGVGFIDSDLTGATFDRVNMDYVLFRNATLTRVDASGAQMAYGKLDGGWDPSMAGLKLDNARMMGFRFVCGVTSGDGCAFDRKQISLRGADLSFASLSTFPMWDGLFDDARLYYTEVGIDQMSMFGASEIAGPVLVKAENRQITLMPDGFRAAATALAGTRTADTECKTPEGPLAEIFCQAGKGTLRAYRDDVQRLFESTRRPVDGSVLADSSIAVTAPDKVHGRYVKALRKCALKDEGAAIPCLQSTMMKRRDVLIAQLVKSRPLESDARALYVSVHTPMVQAVANDPRLSAFAPLMFDSSTQILLAYHDDEEGLQARGYMPLNDGQMCSTSFSEKPRLSGRAKARKKSKSPTMLTTWASGAEFSIGQYAKAKVKKKIKRKGRKKAQVKWVAAAPTTGCNSFKLSDPMIRVPVTEDEFDKLWVTPKTALIAAN
jgi:uncharacterized protein YjbI with pentapeptide repeats